MISKVFNALAGLLSGQSITKTLAQRIMLLFSSPVNRELQMLEEAKLFLQHE
jgi:hypothetical protein